MKKTLAPALALLALVSLNLYLVTPALAAGDVEKQILSTSPLYLLVKIKESVQQFLTFNQSSKAELFESFAEQRIGEMEYADFAGDDEALNFSLDRYQAQKTQALGYVKGARDSRVMDQIREGALEQQSTMTKMQLEIEGSEGVRERIVEVQKEVAGETKRTVVAVQSVEEGVEVENETRYIWLDPNADVDGKLPPLPDEIGKWEYAPGTEGRDDSGKVVEITEGKIKIQWAPGTEREENDKVIIQRAPGNEEGGGPIKYD